MFGCCFSSTFYYSLLTFLLPFPAFSQVLPSGTTTSPPATTKASPVCEDYYGTYNCTKAKLNGNCTQPHYKDYLCKLTCGTCVASECKDEMKCDLVKRYGLCSVYGYFCRKSCGKCVSATTALTTTHLPCKNNENDDMCLMFKSNGFCRLPLFKFHKCRKTCGCHDTGPTTPPATTTAPPVCEDFNGAVNCTRAKQFGLCRFPHYKQELCQRTCGNCVPPPTTNAPGCHDRFPKNICIAVKLRNKCYIYENDYCKKSCGKCDPSTTPSTTTAQTPPNNCHDKISNCHSKDCSNRLYKTTLCRLTCGGCYLPSW